MPRVARVKSTSGMYHIMLRGANKQEIFHDDEDCVKFLDTLEKYKKMTKMNVYAWCLMDNHVHLLLKEGEEDISITMKRIGVSFVMYYNFKYLTTGHLFQDRFKSENVETTRYLLTVVRYIHQNPVKAGMVSRADEWRWSSCQGYYRQSNQAMNLLDDHVILEYFAPDRRVAIHRFKQYNELVNDDKCLGNRDDERRRLSDEEARPIIKEMLDGIEIAQVKSLPKLQRTKVLQKIKRIEVVSQRQAARILGISTNLIYKI
ncbi:REP-associated tyrosine transposase [Bacillus sp. PS06]|uniref:REP-associated tyrosine transposase n=1 Tax=Bacillus sp. PS06 TaxID=2764176 RepID=UPI001781150B|nr:transposase [Bacillus sp. PS06]MBD8071163.1 transposase [Bacillus sp. PS06]